MMAKTMQGAEPGPGERAERAKKRRQAWTIAGLMLAGGASGFALALAENGPEGILEATIGPETAIILASSFLVVCGIGVWFFVRNIDEHELALHYWASTVAAGAYVLVYPVWFLLWKGRLVPEPDHLTLFLLVIVTSFAAYLFKKSR